MYTYSTRSAERFFWYILIDATAAFQINCLHSTSKLSVRYVQVVTCHSASRHLSLVPLPPWLPDFAVAGMMSLYRNRLLKELVAMPRPEHKYTSSDTPSLQSDGAFSLTSNESADDLPRRPWPPEAVPQ